MAGMETCMVNLLEPGDKIVVCSSGFFGTRQVEIAGRTAAQVTPLEVPWGQVFDLNQIRDTLGKVRPKVLSIVHAETSTGAWQPIEQLGKLCHEFNTLLVVDAVTSLGCVPLDLDGWEIDAVYSCTQKGLSCPPGLSPVSFSPRAVEAIGNKTKVQSWYFDVSMVQKYWSDERFYHHTAPITMIYVREGLRLLLEEGLATRWQRHLRNHRALKAGVHALESNTRRRGASVAAAQRGQGAGGRGRSDGSQDAAGGFRHRDRRRPGRFQGEGLAHRAHGLQPRPSACSRFWRRRAMLARRRPQVHAGSGRGGAIRAYAS